MTKLIYENVGTWCHYSTAWFLSSQPQPYQFPHMQAQAMPCWKYPTNTDYPSPYHQNKI